MFGDMRNKLNSAGRGSPQQPQPQQYPQSVCNNPQRVPNAQAINFAFVKAQSNSISPSRNAYQLIAVQQTPEQMFKDEIWDNTQPETQQQSSLRQSRQIPAQFPHVQKTICRQRVRIAKMMISLIIGNSCKVLDYQSLSKHLLWVAKQTYQILSVDLKQAIEHQLTHEDMTELSDEQFMQLVPKVVLNQIRRLKILTNAKSSSNTSNENHDPFCFIESKKVSLMLKEMAADEQKLKELNHQYKGKLLPLLQETHVKLQKQLTARYQIERQRQPYSQTHSILEDIQTQLKEVIQTEFEEMSPAVTNHINKALQVLKTIDQI